MHTLFRALFWGAPAAAMLTLHAPAFADAYKCIQEDGQTLYSSTPCAKDAQAVGVHTSIVPGLGTPKHNDTQTPPHAEGAASLAPSPMERKLNEFVDELKSGKAALASLALVFTGGLALVFFSRRKKAPDADRKKAPEVDWTQAPDAE